MIEDILALAGPPAAYLIGLSDNKVDVQMRNKLVIPEGYTTPLFTDGQLIAVFHAAKSLAWGRRNET